MKQFIENLFNDPYFQQEAPLPEKDILLTQRELVREGYPFLPLSYLKFLQAANGVMGVDSALLGIPPTANGELDIVAYNVMFNQTNNMVIIGYDEFNFLVYNHAVQKYQLIDREDNLVIEEFTEDEIKFALNSVINIQNE